MSGKVALEFLLIMIGDVIETKSKVIELKTDDSRSE